MITPPYDNVTSKKVALIGAGAVGSYVVLGLCDRLGDNFMLIADGSRAEKLKKEGLIINGRRYNPRVVTPTEASGEQLDFLVVAVKYTALHASLEDIAAAVSEHTAVVSLLNGVDSEEIIGARIGMQHMLYAFIKIASTRHGNSISFPLPEGRLGIYVGEINDNTCRTCDYFPENNYDADNFTPPAERRTAEQDSMLDYQHTAAATTCAAGHAMEHGGTPGCQHTAASTTCAAGHVAEHGGISGCYNTTAATTGAAGYAVEHAGIPGCHNTAAATTGTAGHAAEHGGIPGCKYTSAPTPPASSRAEMFGRLFDGSDAICHVTKDILTGMWDKLGVNIARNLTQAVLGVGMGVYEDSRYAADLSCKLRNEVLMVARAKGIKMSEKYFYAPSSPAQRYSTLQDLDAGRKTEIEMFSGAIVRMARELGLSCPYNEAVYDLIKALEEKNSGKFDYRE